MRHFPQLLSFMVIMAVSIGHLWGAKPVEIKLWRNGAPTSNGISSGMEDAANPDWVTYVTDPTVTVYPADKPNGTALLMCPGGAYFGLATAHEGSDLADALNEIGVTLAVLKYRLPNHNHNVPLDDARRAIEILRERGSEWGIMPERIGIGGASAGGHLASTVATHPVGDKPDVSFQVLFYPVISMCDGLTHQGSRENLLGKSPSAELVDFYSNEKHVKPSTPQAIILVSEDDDVVPLGNTLEYYKALRDNSVKTSLHIYPSGGHGWACRERFPYLGQSIDELTGWLSVLEF